MIICLDACELSAAERHNENLQKLVWDAQPSDLDTIVFCLTKVEKLVARNQQHGNHLKQPECLDPVKRLELVLGRTTVMMLRGRLPHTRMGVVGVSAYGFTDDKANCREGTDGHDCLKVIADPKIERSVGEIKDNWSPFRVLEPFVLAGMGGGRSLVRFMDS